MGEMRKYVICQSSYVDLSEPGVRSFCICAWSVFFIVIICICDRSEVCFEFFWISKGT